MEAAPSSLRHRVLGLAAGASLANAAGAPLKHSVPASPIFARALIAGGGAGGGGVLRLAPGQVSDSAELAIVLLRCILYTYPRLSEIRLDHDSESRLVVGAARAYASWLQSAPFACSSACATAFAALRDLFAAMPSDCDGGSNITYTEEALKVERTIAQLNIRRGDSNSALMRASSLSIMGLSIVSTAQTQRQISFVQAEFLAQMAVAQYARADTRLSHPHPPHTADCAAAYAVACLHLLIHPRDASGALSAARAFVSCEDVAEWFEEATANAKWFYTDVNSPTGVVTKDPAHVKHAFMLAVHFLAFPTTSFEDAIVRVLCLGGDCDVNAGVVGAIAGAYFGYPVLPTRMLETVLRFDCTAVVFGELGHTRPKDVSASAAIRDLEEWCDLNGIL
ncbi:hypothetical protein HDU83_009856 [Entophlyctis luteolus]|nr:hypothetical protein HDU82_008651 [Entophlyctis luteolus]KAJ3350185.1 hypothetical protein HDU83_009856 [Entophlyctis luteolus]